jgi:hypothetical protein
LILDLDATSYAYSPNELEKLFNKYRFVAYETYSSDTTFEQFRWRVVFPLARSVTLEEYDQLFSRLTKQHRLDCDHATSRANAIFYLPACKVGDQELKKTINHFGEYLAPQPVKSTPKTSVSLSLDKRVKPSLNTDIRLSKLNKTICGFKVPGVYTQHLSLEQLGLLTNEPAVGMALASICGIDIHKCGIHKDKGRYNSKALKSVLPWHEKDEHPSTGLMVKTKGSNEGRVVYRSFKDVDAENPIFDLHYVYACQVLGKRIPFSKWTRSTSQIWLVRALSDAGVISLPEIRLVGLPSGLQNGVHVLYESMRLLMQCRAALSIYADDAVIFSFSFAEVWSGMSRQTASKHFDVLVKSGIVEQQWVETPSLKCNGFVPKFVNQSTAKSVDRIEVNNTKPLFEQILSVIKHYRIDGKKLSVEFITSHFAESLHWEVVEMLGPFKNYVSVGQQPDRKHRKKVAYREHAT